MELYKVLKPKSEEEIWEFIACLPPNEMLWESARGGFLFGVKAALNRGADINYSNKYSYSSLSEATFMGFSDIVCFLIDQGAEACHMSLISAIKHPPIFEKMLGNVNSELCNIHNFKIMYMVARQNGLNEIQKIIEEHIGTV